MKDEEAISEDKNNFMAPQAKDAIMRCHYEVLELDRSNCTADDVKKQYKKMALKWHPDRNIGQEEDATIRFKEVGAAYAVLSDPHEKKWYDDHRDSILRGSNGRRGNKDDDDVGDCVDLWAFFSSSCYDGMDDSPEGFYTVYAKAFASVVQSENVASEKLLDYPDFGTSTSTHAEVLAFYNQWSNFVSVLSFAWEDEHNPSEAPDRRVRREIEKLNKKNRDAGRKKYMDQISQLVSFVKKRDPRMQAIEELQVAKKAEEAAKKERARADELARRAEEREKYFAKMNDAEEIKRREMELEGAYLLADHEDTDESEDDAWGEIGGRVRRRKKGRKGRHGGRQGDDDSSEEDLVATPIAKTSVGNTQEQANEDDHEAGEITQEDLSFPFKCDLCCKAFREDKQLQQHNNSKPHKQALKDSKKKGGVNYEKKAPAESVDNRKSTTVAVKETNTSTGDVRTFVEKMLGGPTSVAAVQKQMAKAEKAAKLEKAAAKERKKNGGEKKSASAVFTLRGAKGVVADSDSDEENS